MENSHYCTELGRRVRELRIAKGMTQLDLSIDSGVQISKISALESGKHNPTIKTLIKISEALGAEIRLPF